MAKHCPVDSTGPSTRVLAVVSAVFAVGCSVFEPPLPQCEDGVAPRSCQLAPGAAVGVCVTGLQACEEGYWGDCEPAGQGAEVCDGKDNDCDGKNDEAAAANAACATELEHVASATCESGTCRVVECAANYGDCDKKPATGCEESLVDNLAHCGACDNACRWTCGTEGCNEVEQVSMGSAFGCARLTDRSVTCWGDNANLQLGRSGGGDHFLPGQVALASSDIGDDGALQVVAGGRHACAVTLKEAGSVPTGDMVCWGNDEFGQLGDLAADIGTTKGRAAAEQVEMVARVRTASAGENSTCAAYYASAQGYNLCWGSGTFGQLGIANDFATDRLAKATKVLNSVKGSTMLALGAQHTCSLEADNLVFCWGRSVEGQLGNGPLNRPGYEDGAGQWGEPNEPVLRDDTSDALQARFLSARGGHTCAASTVGEVLCWGKNDHGQLGVDTASVDSDVAVRVEGVSKATEVAVGLGHSCALTSGGAVYCWGDGAKGQLGAAPDASPWKPVRVADIADATHISAGDSHTCVTRKSVALTCWGDNAKGQLGVETGSATFSQTPLEPTPNEELE